MDLAYKRALYKNSRTGVNNRGVTCPICGKKIPFKSNWDIHEAIVRRGKVPVSKQHLVFKPTNQVILHHQCHMNHGDSRETVIKSLSYLLAVRGAEQVGRWYKSLWEDNALSVPKGTLLPRQMGINLISGEMLNLGISISLTGVNVSLDAKAIHETAKRWSKARQPRADSHHIYQSMSDGYWTLYMASVVDADPWELVDHKNSLHLFP